MSYTPPVGVVDLTFKRLLPVTADLDFMWGIEVAVMSGAMDIGVSMSGALRQAIVLAGSMQCGISAFGSLALRRDVSRATGVAWDKPMAGSRATESPWSMGVGGDAGTGFHWAPAAPSGRGLSAVWDAMTPVQDYSDLSWGSPVRVFGSTASRWRRLAAAQTRSLIAWRRTASLNRQSEALYRHPHALDVYEQAAWRRADWRHGNNSARWHKTRPLDDVRPLLPWGAGEPPWLRRQPKGGIPETPVQPHERGTYQPPNGTVNLCFWQPMHANADLTFQRHLDPCKYRSTLTMIHSASLVRLPERTPIPFLSARLDFSAGDMAWGANITLPTRAAVDLVAPTVSQQYEVELNIDGNLWWFLVEGYSEGRQFGETNYSIDCRSVSAWLGAPYALPAPQPTDAPYTARQLAEAAVTPLGWTIDWQLLYPGDITPMDWLVPAGAWRHDPMTPIEAVQAIAQACGAIVVPARAARTLAVRYAHPVPRWEWSTAMPDRTLAPSRLVRIGAQFKPAAEYDKVYVFGEAGGVACGVKRTGYAGNKPAPTIIDPLNTHVDCGRERGRQALSAFGNRLDVSIDQPFADTDYGISPVWPGLICEVAETVPWRALSTAISIDLQRDGGESGPLVAAQTITLERAQ